MADIRLAKPAAGTTQTVPSAPDGRFIFDFPADAATLTRSGDNLVLTFEDGASIQLQDFYTTYSKEEMPSFQVEGVEISGQDFFAALGEDLMPAAGPAAGSSASRSGRYNEYGGSDLLDGLDHLGRLDIGFDGGVQLATDTVEPSAYYEDDHGVTVTPSAPGTDPDDPDIPVQGEDFPPTMPHDVLQVDESALDGGSGGGSATAAGSMSVSAPDGVATITIGGVVVWQNGALTGNPVQTDEGHLDVTGFDGTNLTYTYTLDKATQEHGKEGGGENDAIAHEMEVVVTDSDGDSGSAVIRVEITDDVPTIDTAESISLTEGQSTTQSFDVAFGADGAAASGAVTIQGVTADENGVYHLANGTVVINDDNTYTYTADSDAPEGATDSFTLVATDADGDTHTAEVSVSINQSSAPELSVGQVTVDEAHLVPGHTDGGSFSEMVTVTADMLFGAGSNVTLVSAETSTGKGTVRVNEDGSLTYTLTERTEGGSDTSNTADTEADRGTADTAQGDIIKLTVTDAYGNTHVVEVAVNVIDDIPTISTSDMSTSVVPGDSGDNLVKVNEPISFINYKQVNVDENGNPIYEQITDKLSTKYWNDKIIISATKVTYDGTDAWNNPLITGESPKGMSLGYSSYNGGTLQSYNGVPPQEDIESGIAHRHSDGSWYRHAPESDWGLTVNGLANDGEIQAVGNTSEAVVIDLDGYAYGMTINFGAFFAGKPDPDAPAAGTGYDNVSEKALITFYKDGNLVYSTVEEGTNSGEFTFNTGDVILEGFDRVIISAVNNGENSDFTIQGIDFITKSEDPIIVSDGTVTAESGADGFADDYENGRVHFDLEGMVGGKLNEDGTGTMTVLIDGVGTQVSVELNEGSSGESILIGTLSDGKQLFTATLDKDGHWTMEQYKEFRVPGEDGQESNTFELIFKTEDADGDIASTTVDVPLEIVDQQTNDAGTVIGNGNDTIVITGGEGVAGTVAAGDSGGMTEGQQVAANYNVCFILDMSTSMTTNKIGGSGSDSGLNRLEAAELSIQNFIESIAGNTEFTDGSVTVAVIPFAKKAANPIEIKITKESGETTYSYKDKTWSLDDVSKQLVDAINTANVDNKFVTDYGPAFSEAASWYNQLGDSVESATGNITYFLTDGRPAGFGTDEADKDDYERAWEGYQKLLAAQGDGHIDIHAIGFGKDLLETDMENLAMFDNTAQAVGDAHVANGYFEASNGTYIPVTYEHPAPIDRNETYYVDIDGRLQEVTYSSRHDAWGYYWFSWKNVDEADLLERVIVPITGGTSQQVTDTGSLSAAFTSGFNPGALVAAGSDIITAEDSDSSVIIYGDVMNTDRLRYELGQYSDIAAALLAAGIDYGSGSEVFQWLENAAKADTLKGTKFEGWTHDDTLKYMLEHAEELGYETRLDDSGTFYLVKPDGTVLDMSGQEVNIALDSLTGRGGGDDVITGSSASDTIYGQEGDDSIYGGSGHDTLYGGTGDDLLVGDGEPGSVADLTVEKIMELGTGDDLDAFILSVEEGLGANGNDQLFGGVGNDVLLGMGDDDYLDGGAGKDAIFGGSGNDIIVYDKADYLVSGGSGIDFMVSTDSELTMKTLLGGIGDGNGPIVKGIEVLLKGEDALSLTSLDQLAKDYGITLDTNAEGKETLILDMDKWTYHEESGVYTSNKGALTLETNLTPVEASDPASEAVQQQVFTLEHGNG